MLTDTHCHLFYDELENNLSAVLERARDLGVGRFICVATNLKDSRDSLQLSINNKNIFASAGIQPHDAAKAPVNFVEQIHEREFRIILTQGLNRQIRRMCEYLGYEVKKLKRTRIMNMHLDMPEGTWRDFKPEELAEMNRLLESSKTTY